MTQSEAEVRFARTTGKLLLHRDHLQPFKEWLASQGVLFRPPTGLTQVIQVKVGNGWAAIHRNKSFKFHYTVSITLAKLLDGFKSVL